MTSEPFFYRLQAHADVKLPVMSLHQRDRRGLNAALAKAHRTIQAFDHRTKAGYLSVKGMMRSLANVHCEPFVPPPNGVVPFKDVS